MSNVIGSIPEFSEGSLSNQGQEEVKQAAADEVVEQATDTPTELPADTEPALDTQSEDTGEEEVVTLLKAKAGLEAERTKLLKQISELKGQRRDIKQEQLLTVQDKLDDLKDVNPSDVELIEKVLKNKGYVKKDDVLQLTYEEVKNQELKQFLDKYPEYKPENDPNDLKWSTLQREFGEFARPSDPHRIGYLLEKAHRANLPASERDLTTVKKQQVKTASVGSGGVQRSSPNKVPDSRLAKLMETHMTGFSEEEKRKMLGL